MSPDNLPSRASVVVIGGGVMGCSTLYHLAKFGVTDAVLLERNELTSGTTWHSAAQVRALRSTRNMTELIRYSVALYSALEKETGQATGWINKGSLSIATSEDRLIHIKRQEALAHLFGVQATSISPGEAAERWPLMNADDVIGAVWSPGDGRVSPSDLCAALVKGARARGAKVFEKTGVTGVLTRNGAITGVETARGVMACDAIALCAGLWSRDAAAMAGADAPVWPCEHFYLLTKPVEGVTGAMPTLSDHDGHLYVRDDSGGLLVGCFEPMGKAIAPGALGEDFAFQLLGEDWDHFEPMMMNALHRLPALETAEVRMLLNGPESFTPDGAFLLGEAAETRGLFLGCGMNSVGVATGGGAGMALARNIVDGHLPFDLHEVDPKRFANVWNDVSHLSARVPEVLGRHYEITYPGRQWKTARMKRTLPLHNAWVEAGAYFGEFYGWERPLYFGAAEAPALTFGKPAWSAQVEREVLAARDKAAVFDQSALGKIDVKGDGAEAFLNHVCTNDMTMAPGRVRYTLMLNERGGIESDLLAVRHSETCYRLHVGSGAVKRDLAWLSRHLNDEDNVTMEEVTQAHAILALTGGEAADIVSRLGAPELNKMKTFTVAEASIAGVAVTAARFTYVGEPGWEITCQAPEAQALYRALKNEGAAPAGLFAQTSMRIEKRFLAYGHDIDTDITPFEAGLDFVLAWDTGFIGKEASVKTRGAKPARTITTLVFEDRDAVPQGNEPVLQGSKVIGKTTSSAYGFRIGAPIALALTEPLENGALVSVNIAGIHCSARARF